MRGVANQPLLPRHSHRLKTWKCRAWSTTEHHLQGNASYVPPNESPPIYLGPKDPLFPLTGGGLGGRNIALRDDSPSNSHRADKLFNATRPRHCCACAMAMCPPPTVRLLTTVNPSGLTSTVHPCTSLSPSLYFKLTHWDSRYPQRQEYYCLQQYDK